MAASLSIPALGKVASLGDLYDARSDSFINGLSIFTGPLPEDILLKVDNRTSETDFIYDENAAIKFDKLNVEAQLKLSILAGLVKLEGSGRYLQETKSSARAVNVSLLYNITTVKENINFSDSRIRQIISTDVLRTIGDRATHVVCGIQWGGKAIVKVEYANTDNENKKEIKGMLSAEIERMAFAIKGAAQGSYDNKESNVSNRYALKMYGDFLPERHIVQDIESALSLIKEMPDLVTKGNEGKGKALQFYLLHLPMLSYFGFEVTCDAVVKLVNEVTINSFISTFDVLHSNISELRDIYEDYREQIDFVTEKIMQNIAKMIDELTANELNMTEKLKHCIVDVRAGKQPVDTIENILKEFKLNNFQTIVGGLREEFAQWCEKIKFYMFLRKKGVDVLGSKDSLHTIKRNYQDKNLIIFYHLRDYSSGSKSKQENLFQ